MGAGAFSQVEAESAVAGGTARIAVCATEETLRDRIAGALELGGYEPVPCCDSPELDSADSLNVSLVVIAHRFEPFARSSAVLTQPALGGLPLVIVGSGFIGGACRRLIPDEIEGFVAEADIEQALAPTIEAVLAGQLCLPSAMRETLARPVFSHREKQVLELVLAGLTNGEIAARLYLTESTVKSHLASSFRKLGVSSRAEAARSMLAPDAALELRALSRLPPRPSLVSTPAG